MWLTVLGWIGYTPEVAAFAVVAVETAGPLVSGVGTSHWVPQSWLSALAGGRRAAGGGRMGPAVWSSERLFPADGKEEAVKTTVSLPHSHRTQIHRYRNIIRLCIAQKKHLLLTDTLQKCFLAILERLFQHPKGRRSQIPSGKRHHLFEAGSGDGCPTGFILETAHSELASS